MMYKPDRAWAEIDLDAIAHNVREIRKITNKATELMGVVKADAYGHGVREVAGTLLENGITRLAVATLDEAIQIRKMGIKAPILVLSYSDPARAEEIVLNNVTQTVFSRDLALALSAASVKLDRTAAIHVKVDTGMTRVGLQPGAAAAREVAGISKLPGLFIEGIFTHFASADENERDYTILQFKRFTDFCGELEGAGIHIPLKHVCNSAGIIQYPEMHMDLVRPGIILYGLYPSRHIDRNLICLKPAMAYKARITLVKDVEPEVCISYGRTFRTKRPSRIATIPIGYADGYPRLLSNKGRMLVNGEIAPVVGTVCMDQCMIDVTDLKHEVHTGDEAVIFGTQGGACISADEVAAGIGTISYEVVCGVSKRIPRVYLKDGKIISVLNYLT